MEAKKIEILTEQDIIAARSAGRDMARKGTCTLSDKSNERAITIHVVAEDSGPGIEDIEQAMEFGFSTSKGLGAGLPGTKRLVSKFKIGSEPGHTMVTIELTKRKFI